MFYNKADQEVHLVMEFIDGVTITDLVLFAQKFAITPLLLGYSKRVGR